MHAHHTALPVSVPGRLQFIEACLERFSVHHVLIVGICLFDGFVNRTENEIVKFKTSNVELPHQQVTMSLNKHLYIGRRVRVLPYYVMLQIRSCCRPAASDK